MENPVNGQLSNTSPRISMCSKHTLLPEAWQDSLTGHPDQELTQFFLKGIQEGFRIGFTTDLAGSLKSSRENLLGARQHPDVVDKYLDEEVALKRVASPFSRLEFSSIQISRFGVIPKGHQKDKWRLIVDLSHPKSHSVNDGIQKSLCGLSYITIDDAIEKIL